MKTIRDIEDPLLMGEGCPLHGDECIRECTQCGIDFCARCHPRRMQCPECVLDDEASGDSDDTDDLNDLSDEEDIDISSDDEQGNEKEYDEDD